MAIDDRFQHMFSQIVQAREELRQGSGDGTSGGMSDDWKASVDRQLGQLHGDVRALLYGLVGGFLFLIVGGVGAYIALDSKSDARFGKIEDRLTAIERKIDATDAGVNAKLDALLAGKTAAAAK